MSNDTQDVLKNLLEGTPCLPVVSLDNAAEAVSVAKALVEGGINNIEVTLRSEGAIDAIRAIVQSDEDIIVGAGTVYTALQVEDCARAGAAYIVSPGYSDAVHKACDKAGLPYLPGAVTATEIQAAREKGFRYLKFFPAEASGGVDALKALASVFQDIQFCATGGVSAKNFSDYLELPNIVAVGMSAIVSKDDIKSRDWDRITANGRVYNGSDIQIVR